MTNDLSRRQWLGGAAGAALVGLSASASPAAQAAGANDPFLYSLNTSTIRGQKLPITREVEIAGHMTFGGYLDKAPKGFVARRMARKWAGDWRDPEQVAEWVGLICRQTAVGAAIPAQRTDGAWAPPQVAAEESGQTTR